MKKFLPLLLVPAAIALADGDCTPKQPAACNLDSCTPCYCLGPTDPIANAPVRPYTCDGDLEITAAALYWKATQDGMEYGVIAPSPSLGIGNAIIDSQYLSPDYHPTWGCRFGVAYNSPCDGWNVDLVWTHLNAQINSVADLGESTVLLGLWSAFSSGSSSSQFPFLALRALTSWSPSLNLIDLNLGREYWISKFLSIHPTIGLRSSSLRQKFQIEYAGGTSLDIEGDKYNDEVVLKNNYEGLGILAGLDLSFNIGCGWSITGILASSILYGKFNTSHDEGVQQAFSPFRKIPVLETKNSFKASRAILDLALGIQWRALVSGCKYGFTGSLAWENHLFFHQNQMWRVERVQQVVFPPPDFPNNNGGNDLNQQRGTFATGGLTLTFKFDF